MKGKHLFFIALALFAGTTAWADVSYIDADGHPATCTNYQVLDNIIAAAPYSDKTIGYENMDNWFVVQGSDVVLNGQLGYVGNLNLILCDGAKLTVTKTDGNAIECLDEVAQTLTMLTIYVQSGGTGQLVANAYNNYTAIHTESLTIHGGTITANGSNNGIHAPQGNVVINKGTVTATGQNGNGIEGYNVTINGGNVSATGADTEYKAGIVNGQTGTITLGYTANTDRIYVSSYKVGNTASLRVKNGQYLITDDGQFVYGSYGRDYVGFLAGHTLSPFNPTEWSGSGDSANDPYIIASEDDLRLLSLRTNSGGQSYSGKYFKLGANIIFPASSEWNDGESSESNFSSLGGFGGHFDGDVYSISGLRIREEDGVGLFGYLAEGGVVENITLTNSRITGNTQIGGIVGNLQEGATVNNCHVSNTVYVYSKYHYTGVRGGVVGRCNGGTISNCLSEAAIGRTSQVWDNVNDKAGGIVGEVISGTVSGNLVIGANISCYSEHYGAIAGINNEGTLTNNYYRACTINSTDNATGVGCDGADVTTGDGALSLHTISVPNTVAIMTEPTLAYNTVNYWAQSKEVTLSGGLNDTPTEGWQKAYFVNDAPNTGDAYGFTPSSSYAMPATDVTISVGEIHADWETAQTGESNNPYRIYFTDQLDLLAARVNIGRTYGDKYFKLMDNMEYDNTKANNYTAIGTGDHPFSGHFDGNSKVVSGIRISGGSYQGIFGALNGGSVANLFVIDTEISGTSQLGVIAGSNSGGTLSNNYYLDCSVNGVTTGIGCNGADVTASDGALSLHTITKPNTVTIVTAPTLTYSAVNYWAQGKAVTLSGGLNDTPTEGWQKAYFVNGTANTNDAYEFTPSDNYDMPATDVKITVGEIHADWETAQTGESNNPYRIYFTDQLDLLAARVNIGRSYGGMYFKLMDNMEYDRNVQNNYTVIGFGDNPFSGHFDGDGKAISGIRIMGTYKYQGVFGKLLYGSIANLFVQDAVIVSGNSNTGVIAGYNGGTLTNNYYFDCNVNGYTTGIGCGGRDVTVNDGARPVFTLGLASGITASATVTLTHDETNYYKSGTTVTLDATTPPAPGKRYIYSVNGSPIEGNTFDMETNTSVTVEQKNIDWETEYAGTADDPYLIYNTYQWNLLASRVNGGTSYENKFFKLMEDISVTDMIGSDADHAFKGTFDGDGHTLDVDISWAYDFIGPFRFTYGATIKNLITTGTIVAHEQYAGGVVGRNGTGKLTLSNVTSNVTIDSRYSGQAFQGGLVGYTIQASFDRCVFTGKLLGSSSTGCGGLLGYKTYESDNTRKAVFSYCLFAPAEVSVSSTGFYTFANNSTGGVVTINDSYYAYPHGTEQGPCGIMLYNSGVAAMANAEVIRNYTSYQRTVRLQDRTLYKDGNWNTICLPVVDNVSGTALDGCTLMELDTVGWYDASGTRYVETADGRHQTGFNSSDGTLYLYFKAATYVEAGKPYLIKWASGSDIVGPNFNNAIISATSPTTVTSNDGHVEFRGNFSPVHLEKDNKCNLFVGADNNLHWPTADNYYVNSFRAYFHVDLGGAAAPERIIFNTGEESTVTGLDEVNGQTDEVQCTRFLKDGILYILRDGIIFDALGRKVK